MCISVWKIFFFVMFIQRYDILLKRKNGYANTYEKSTLFSIRFEIRPSKQIKKKKNNK